jgi:hypothetical protein
MHTTEHFAMKVKRALLELLNSVSTYHFVILLITPKNFECRIMKGSRDSVVGIMTHYGLNGPKFEPRWSKKFIFSIPVHTTSSSNLPSIKCVKGLFQGVERSGVELNSTVKVKNSCTPVPSRYLL